MHWCWGEWNDSLRLFEFRHWRSRLLDHWRENGGRTHSIHWILTWRIGYSFELDRGILLYYWLHLELIHSRIFRRRRHRLELLTQVLDRRC